MSFPSEKAKINQNGRGLLDQEIQPYLSNHIDTV